MNDRPTGRPRRTRPEDFPQRDLAARKEAAALSRLIGRAGGSQALIEADPGMLAAGLRRPQRVTDALDRPDGVPPHQLEAIVAACAVVLGDDPETLLASVQSRHPGDSEPFEAAHRTYSHEDRLAYVKVLLTEGRPSAAAQTVWSEGSALRTVRDLAEAELADAAALIVAAVADELLPRHEVDPLLETVSLPDLTRAVERDLPPVQRPAAAPMASIRPEHEETASRWARALARGRADLVAAQLLLDPGRNQFTFDHGVDSDQLQSVGALFERVPGAQVGKVLTLVAEADSSYARRLLAAIGDVTSLEQAMDVASTISRRALSDMLRHHPLRAPLPEGVVAALSPSVISDCLWNDLNGGLAVDRRAFAPTERLSRALVVITDERGASTVAAVLADQLSQQIPHVSVNLLAAWGHLCVFHRESAVSVLAASFSRHELAARLLEYLAQAGHEATAIALLVRDALGGSADKRSYDLLQASRSPIGMRPSLWQALTDETSVGARLIHLWARIDVAELRNEIDGWSEDGFDDLARRASAICASYGEP